MLDSTLVRASSGDRVPASQLLRQPEVRLADLLAAGSAPALRDRCRADATLDIASAETTVKYAGYLRRQESEIERGRKDERRRIPHDFPFDRVPGLSREVVQRLTQVRPDTLGQALRIPGVTPAAVAVLGAFVGRLSAPPLVTSLEFRDRLARRTRRAKAPLTLAMLDPLEAYFRLLTQWNAKINLTALPLDPPTDETFDRLLVEPLGRVDARFAASMLPSVWFDLGSGGGSPAIPLKIARPRLRLTMIESKERKSAFLREAVRSLGLAGRGRADRAVRGRRAASPNTLGTADLVTVRAVKSGRRNCSRRPDRLLKHDGPPAASSDQLTAAARSAWLPSYLNCSA